jgi:hypothetical protein
MGNLKIKTSQNLSFWTKRVFVNNKYYGKFSSNSTTIDIDNDCDDIKIRIELLWGYYSSEINAPKSENQSYVIFIEDKLSYFYNISMLIVACFTILDVVKFHLLSFFFSLLLLYGTPFLIFLFDLTKRKKRFSVSIYTLE